MLKLWTKSSVTPVLAFILVSLFYCLSAQAEPPKPFYADSLKKIEANYRGQPFLLSIWSVNCPPCQKELALLSKLKKEQPEFNLVLISTDAFEPVESVERFLRSFSLSDVDSWVYGITEQERLRYSIDKEWYGEMPRSYFYDDQGGRRAISGLLSEDLLRNWVLGNSNRL